MKPEEWIVPDGLNLHQRETLHILALSAGFKSKGIFFEDPRYEFASVREFTNLLSGPRLYFFSHDSRSADKGIPRVSFEDAVQFFKTKIERRNDEI